MEASVQDIHQQQEGNQHHLVDKLDLQVDSLLQLEDTLVLQEDRLELVQEIQDPQHHQDTEKQKNR